MTNRTDEACTHDSSKHPLVVRVTDNDFQCEVLEKLARPGSQNGHAGRRQPARPYEAGRRSRWDVRAHDIRRSVYDRLLNATITIAISAMIAFHDKWWK